MTKEQFLNKWVVISVVRDKMQPDLEAVIATEIAKIKEQPQPEDICYKCENKTNNKFAICDKCNVGWNEPKQEAQPEELKGNCSTFDGSRLVDQEKTALNPIAEAYERGEKIRYKNWLKKDWIQKHNETKTIDNNCFINSVFSFGFIQHPQLWELYTEPEQVAKPAEQPAKPFDKDRFEAMFRAVYQSTTSNFDKCIEYTKENLTKLDAYYASKEGGENGI